MVVLDHSNHILPKTQLLPARLRKQGCLSYRKSNNWPSDGFLTPFGGLNWWRPFFCTIPIFWTYIHVTILLVLFCNMDRWFIFNCQLQYWIWHSFSVCIDTLFSRMVFILSSKETVIFFPDKIIDFDLRSFPCLCSLLISSRQWST